MRSASKGISQAIDMCCVDISFNALIVVLLFAISTLLALTMTPYLSTAKSSDFVVYENPDFDIRMEYPGNWSAWETDLPPYIVVALLPNDSLEEDIIPVGLSVEVIPLLAGYPSFGDGIRALEESIKTSPDTKYVDSSNTALSGLPAFSIQFYENSNGTTNKIMYIATEFNNEVFGLQYNAEPEYFDEYLPIVKSMIDSFQIASSPTALTNDDFAGDANSTSAESLLTKSGYDIGCGDVGLYESEKYITQPGNEPSSQTQEFMDKYYRGYYECGGTFPAEKGFQPQEPSEPLNTPQPSEPLYSPQPSQQPMQVRIDWWDICNNPIVDAVITEPCSTLVTPDGYGLTSEGERVLFCVVGGAALYLIDPAAGEMARQLGPSVGCGW